MCNWLEWFYLAHSPLFRFLHNGFENETEKKNILNIAEKHYNPCIFYSSQQPPTIGGFHAFISPDYCHTLMSAGVINVYMHRALIVKNIGDVCFMQKHLGAVMSSCDTAAMMRNQFWFLGGLSWTKIDVFWRCGYTKVTRRKIIQTNMNRLWSMSIFFHLLSFQTPIIL